MRPLSINTDTLFVRMYRLPVSIILEYSPRYPEDFNEIVLNLKLKEEEKQIIFSISMST